MAGYLDSPYLDGPYLSEETTVANRKFIFVNSDYNYEEAQESVTTSGGSGDSGKLATLGSDGKWDLSLIPDSIINKDFKDSVRVATTAALPAVTYDNGTAGVGATLTADANGALAAIDGVTLSVGEFILVKNQASALQNGIYEVTAVGDGSNPFILTRREDADEDSEVSGGMIVPIEEGTANGDKVALLTSNGTIDIGTDAQVFAMQNTTNLIAGDGIDITAGTISVDLVADGGLEFASGELQVKFADTSVTGDLDGTNGLHAISAQDLYSNGANQGADILGFDPTTAATSLPSMAGQNFIDDAINTLAAAVAAGGSVYYTSGEALSKGALVYVSGNDEASLLPISGVGSENWGIGLAATAVGSAASVQIVENDTVLTGVLTALTPTAGDKVYWSGSALTLTPPAAAGSMVWMVGVAKNADDLHVDIRQVKKNAA